MKIVELNKRFVEASTGRLTGDLNGSFLETLALSGTTV